eukprot:SAG11_NODE_19320_length_469_cov_0.959459_1_plen_34_part_01
MFAWSSFFFFYGQKFSTTIFTTKLRGVKADPYL